MTSGSVKKEPESNGGGTIGVMLRPCNFNHNDLYLFNKDVVCNMGTKEFSSKWVCNFKHAHAWLHACSGMYKRLSSSLLTLTSL